MCGCMYVCCVAHVCYDMYVMYGMFGMYDGRMDGCMNVCPMTMYV